ncbi:MAG: hypothetical protein UZ15_CFX003000561 [Chloroflexi bacterium OLB15]|nr:MAG: hypothetical protein UZ15_CFX003000561 [Chloroflexi bacterium OLB15]
MNNSHQRKPISQALKAHSEREILPFTPTTAPLMKLQSTIGNRAMQRMLAHNSVIQRDTGSNGGGQAQPADNQQGKYAALLTIYVDGAKLKGTSKVSGYEEAIEILSYQPVQPAFANRRRDTDEKNGRTDGGELALIKSSDATSSKIIEANTAGSAVKFKLVGGKFDNEGKFTPYLTIESDDAYISAYSFSSGDHGNPIDSFNIMYMPAKKK